MNKYASLAKMADVVPERARCECHECTQARWKMSGQQYQQQSAGSPLLGANGDSMLASGGWQG